jgi:hypothetical protein
MLSVQPSAKTQTVSRSSAVSLILCRLMSGYIRTAVFPFQFTLLHRPLYTFNDKSTIVTSSLKPQINLYLPPLFIYGSTALWTLTVFTVS